METDFAWEQWARKDPYFGVLTNPKFRRAVLNSESLAEFYETGHSHVNHILNTCRRRIDFAFNPRSILDFGCGAGRLLVPFARNSDQVVALDVSPTMLSIARTHCVESSVENVSFIESSSDSLREVSGVFDLVHTSMVLQHIPVHRGRQLFGALLRRVAPGGIAAIHATYGWRDLSASLGQPPVIQPKAAAPAKHFFRRKVTEQSGPAKAQQADPEMQMNVYSMNELMFLLHAEGMSSILLEMTDHDGALGAFIFAQRSLA